MIVMGTSLTVHPFASLTQLVPDSCPRVLINMDQAGDIGTRSDDVLLLGKSDEIVRQLCAALGEDWVEELDAVWKETEKYAGKEQDEEKVAETTAATKDEKVLAESEALQDEVDKLTKAVEKSLQIGEVPTDNSSITEQKSILKEEESPPPAEPSPPVEASSETPGTTPQEKGSNSVNASKKVSDSDSPPECKVVEVPVKL